MMKMMEYADTHRLTHHNGARVAFAGIETRDMTLARDLASEYSKCIICKRTTSLAYVVTITTVITVECLNPYWHLTETSRNRLPVLTNYSVIYTTATCVTCMTILFATHTLRSKSSMRAQLTVNSRHFA
jgi:hypothetical protein